MVGFSDLSNELVLMMWDFVDLKDIYLLYSFLRMSNSKPTSCRASTTGSNIDPVPSVTWVPNLESLVYLTEYSRRF